MSTDPRQLTIEEILIRGADPSERKHGGNPQSVEAHKRVLPSKEATYKRIMEVLAKGPQTSKEIAAVLNVQLNCVSGRFSEMKQLCWIEETGERREGAAELKAVKPVDDFDLVKCPKCSGEIVVANIVRCFVCDDAPEMCYPCQQIHIKAHSEVEIDAALCGAE